LSDKINSVTCASSWNYILEYYYDARTHEHYTVVVLPDLRTYNLKNQL